MDPVTGKCRWRNTLQEEDIRLPYFKLSDRLSMLGVDLTWSWQTTRKINCDELKERVRTIIGAWKLGRQVSLICRPFSLSTYCLGKVWFRTGVVDLREGD